MALAQKTDEIKSTELLRWVHKKMCVWKLCGYLLVSQ